MMKPKAQSEHEEGMLEYLEDIIGSSRFKEPIEQLANEVETLNEARGEKVQFGATVFVLTFVFTCIEGGYYTVVFSWDWIYSKLIQ